MAMIKCKECGANISDKAATCPHCGAPVAPMTQANKNHIGCLPSLLIVVVATIGIVYYLSNNPDADTQSQASSDKNAPSICSSTDLDCLINKGGGFVAAGVYCQEPIEKLALHDMKWTDGTFDSKFSLAKWAPEGNGVIEYIGDKAKFQNGFGAYTNVVYACDLASDNQTVVNVKIIRDGYLPSD
ncbi:MAG: zinc-ribbon domain-containing protein [Halothiobacillus sp.]